MTRLNPLQWPIRWQIVGLVLVTQFLAQIVTIFSIDMATARNGGGRADLAISVSEPFLTALRLTPAQGSPGSTERLEALARLDDRFRLQAMSPVPDAPTATAFDPEVQTAIKGTLPPSWQSRVVVYPLDRSWFPRLLPVRPFAIAAPLSDGTWFIFEARSDTFIQNMPRAVALMGLTILAFVLAFLSIWAGVFLVSPIAALARGAERFSTDIEAPALAETGAVELRRATRAFNLMRQKIRKLLSDRSQTLAAIGHDMRTPLTRLRLRVELLDPSDTVTAINADIAALERMIDDALGFLRSENRPLRLDQADVAILAQTVVGDYTDRGHAITYGGPANLVLVCDHDLLRRALDNIVGNAAKFAETASLNLWVESGTEAIFEVRDNGPGIPLDHRDKVLEPFTRIEAVRSGIAQNGQGFGLGLAIARDLVERHGGTLTLHDNQPVGLVVRMALPVTAAQQGAPDA
jgi:signal transduction histidine kinase